MLAYFSKRRDFWLGLLSFSCFRGSFRLVALVLDLGFLVTSEPEHFWFESGFAFQVVDL